jgi:hypothetical protein
MEIFGYSLVEGAVDPALVSLVHDWNWLDLVRLLATLKTFIEVLHEVLSVSFALTEDEEVAHLAALLVTQADHALEVSEHVQM